MLRTVTDLPIRAIIYSHEHYVNGTRAMVEAEAKRGNTNIKIIGHPRTNDEIAKTGGVSAIHPEVGSVLLARSVEQFNFYLPSEGPDAAFKNTLVPGFGGFVPVDTPVEDGQRLKVAGLELVFFTEGIATDTRNQVMVWIPSRKIVLNNIIWGWFPNIYSARGGRYRSPERWIEAVDRIRSLKPEILLSTHHTSLVGAELIMKRLDNYRDALAFVLDQTLKGILLGLGPDELRYYVKLPDHLQHSPSLIQNYGEIALMPPRIYTALFGQFDRNAAHLNKLHPLEEAQRMVQAMGGPDRVEELVKKAYKDGDYLWAGQLADYLQKAYDTRAHRQLKADCLRQMGYRALSTNSRSWYLSQALALEGKVHIVTTFPAMPAAVDTNIADYVNFYRIRISPERSGETDAVLGFHFEGQETSPGLHIRRGVVQFVPELSVYSRSADMTVRMTTAVWAEVFNNMADPSTLIDEGKIVVEKGDATRAKELFSLFDPVYDWEHDKALKELARKIGLGDGK
jgi:alkyl sulfatase BDS1-like metallo-beta-lactamase superfamily hydrolase